MTAHIVSPEPMLINSVTCFELTAKIIRIKILLKLLLLKK